MTTVLLLTLAGTSVMTALSVLLPQFLLRFGMELKWTSRWGILLMLFGLVNLAGDASFRADVDDQRGAYATGVLVSCRAPASSPCCRGDTTCARKGPAGGRGTSSGCRRLCADHRRRPCDFADGAVHRLWFHRGHPDHVGDDSGHAQRRDAHHGLRLRDAPGEVSLGFAASDGFPCAGPTSAGLDGREDKEACIRRDHNLDPQVEIVFLEIEVDDPSNFYQRLLIDVVQEDKRYVIKVTRCVSIAHAIAAIALEMSLQSKPPGLHFGWTNMHLLAASWSYLAFGEGNIPSKVRELIHHLQPDVEKRPRVIVG